MEVSIYLIRHGETVDNVAGVYAGVRDSALSNYGVDQTKRLGEHFAKNNVQFTHIFTSPLSRAHKTAEAVQSAQPKPNGKHDICIVKVQELMEQNFGFYEGKTFQARTEAKKTGREAHRDRHFNDPGFVDVESKDSINERADNFLRQHLLPLFDEEHNGGSAVVAVVSHGIFLSHLWKRLLLCLPAKSVTIAPDVIAAKGPIVLQHLGGWSNTGVLKLKMRRVASKTGQTEEKISERGSTTDLSQMTPIPSLHSIKTAANASQPKADIKPKALVLSGWMLSIDGINRTDHLVNLKRQRGGIGSIAHDDSQQKLDGFFKRQRTR